MTAVHLLIVIKESSHLPDFVPELMAEYARSPRMRFNELAAKRFVELEQQGQALRKVPGSGMPLYPSDQWSAWATSVMNLLEGAFGKQSIHFVNFKSKYDNYKGYPSEVESAKGIFAAARDDFEGGYIFTLEAKISGEIFGDIVVLAKEALANGNDAAAAVLASAALEDALKRYATRSGLDVAGKNMQDVISALKAQGLVSGAQKTLLDTMPKIRNYAMHADWDKLGPSDIGGVIGFVEQFLISHF